MKVKCSICKVIFTTNTEGQEICEDCKTTALNVIYHNDNKEAEKGDNNE